jgi:hypothetical protein
MPIDKSRFARFDAEIPLLNPLDGGKPDSSLAPLALEEKPQDRKGSF